MSIGTILTDNSGQTVLLPDEARFPASVHTVGLIRWLRPEYQHPTGETAPQQIEVELA